MSRVPGKAVVVLRVLAGLAFCYAGWMKIQSPQSFADSIAAFQLLPARLINLLALGLPPFELVTGVWLLVGWRVRTAAFCGLAATTFFLFALISAMLRGLPVECGCFGEVDSALTPAQRLALATGRDLLLAAAILIVYLDALRCNRRL